jgi:hypothetical protein
MANQKGKDAFAFVKDYLAAHKGAPFAEVRDAAKAKGHKIYPIVYGRAQLLLGHVKSKPAGKAKPGPKKAAKVGRPPAAAAVAAPAVVRRGPGRPPKAKPSAGLVGIEGVVQHVRNLERERDQLLSVIGKLRDVLASL